MRIYIYIHRRAALCKAMQWERAARADGSSEAVEVSEMQVRHI